jgi:hypothetical protein
VDEATWLACTEPQPMLEFRRDWASDRKFRLFAVACCRRIDRLITDPRSRDALEFAERHADRGVVRRRGRPGLERAARAAHLEAYNKVLSFPPGAERARCLIVSNALDAAAQTLSTHPFLAAHFASSFAAWAVAWETQVASGLNPYPDTPASFKGPEQAHQACLVRDLFGNPFRPVTVAQSWLTWGGGTVAQIAQGIYADGAFDRLPVLADALEDAGCTDAVVLDHLRGPGPHARGCWAVDVLLDKR